MIILLLLAASALAQDDAGRILAPPDAARFKPGEPIRLIARVPAGAAIQVDGAPVATDSPHQGVATAELKLASGAHTIALGNQTVRIAVGDGIDGTKPFRPHPPVSDCTSCHAVRNGRWRYQRASLSNVCSKCHSAATFQPRHTHEMGLLPDCQMCHDPHGSTAAAHMKMDRDTACRQCHALQK
jgi:predicted CXXCH cytochrome family protein